MTDQLIYDIKNNFSSKNDQELLLTYKENNRQKYSNEAFEAIKLLLLERNITLPVQDLYISKNRKRKLSKNYKITRILSYFFLSASIIIPILINLHEHLNYEAFCVIHFIPWIIGFYLYVQKKGLPIMYFFLCIFSLFGFILVAIKEDLGENRSSDVIKFCKSCNTEHYINDIELEQEYFICETCDSKNQLFNFLF